MSDVRFTLNNVKYDTDVISYLAILDVIGTATEEAELVAGINNGLIREVK